MQKSTFPQGFLPRPRNQCSLREQLTIALKIHSFLPMHSRDRVERGKVGKTNVDCYLLSPVGRSHDLAMF